MVAGMCAESKVEMQKRMKISLGFYSLGAINFEILKLNLKTMRKNLKLSLTANS